MRTLIAVAGTIITIIILSVIPITAHADTLSIKGVNCPLTEDSDDPGVGFTRCNFPDNFVPKNGRVELTDANGISDIIWVHNAAKNHFHFISDPILTWDIAASGLDAHEGEFNTELLGSVVEIEGPMDISKFFGLAAKSVVVSSDADPSKDADVPEPATLSLLVVGLAGLGYRLRQRKL